MGRRVVNQEFLKEKYMMGVHHMLSSHNMMTCHFLMTSYHIDIFSDMIDCHHWRDVKCDATLSYTLNCTIATLLTLANTTG